MKKIKKMPLSSQIQALDKLTNEESHNITGGYTFSSPPYSPGPNCSIGGGVDVNPGNVGGGNITGIIRF